MSFTVPVIEVLRNDSTINFAMFEFYQLPSSNDRIVLPKSSDIVIRTVSYVEYFLLWKNEISLIDNEESTAQYS